MKIYMKNQNPNMRRTQATKIRLFFNHNTYLVNGRHVSEKEYKDTMNRMYPNENICPPRYHWVKTYNRKSKKYYGSEEIALFVEEPDENHLLFSMGHDIFKGMTRDAIPSPVIGLYSDDVVIFSEGKEILASSDMNIGQVISAVIKEQERLLSKDLERAYLEQFLKMKDLKGKENSKMEGDIQ